MVTLVLVTPVFPIDDAAACVIVLVLLLLLLPAPVDEEDALAEEVLVDGDDPA